MLDQAEVLSQAQSCFGRSCELERIERFVDGVHKQTFDVRLRNPSNKCLLIVWNNDRNYFLEREAAGFEEPHSDAIAPHAFRAHTQYLSDLGVNVPQILHFDQFRSGHYFAFVELIVGSDYDSLRAQASWKSRSRVPSNLSGQVKRLHGVARDYPGRVSDGHVTDGPSLLEESLEVARIELGATADSEPFVAEHHDRILDTLEELRAAIQPRETFRLLHGELDPSHILVSDEDQRVYLVDIEGVSFGDLESEHVFLKWRFSEEDYQYLARGDFDQDRLTYYKLLMHVSLVYAGSRLLIREYPE